ncbi:MAG: OmpA family protein [Methylococcales bacterium]|nr:OmpA family protein [Methylococcales bacterium]
MKKTLLLIASITLSGCATQTSNPFQSFQAKDLNRLVRTGHLKQKKQSFFVINDSSSSMSDPYLGSGFSGQATATKLSVEKELLNRMNQTIPNIKLSSGLRSFGFGPCVSWGFSKLNQATQRYSTASFADAINSLECSSGGTNVTSSFTAASADLASASGTIALILLSDGHNYDSSPIPQVHALKQQYGNKLCIYTVWVGNKKEQAGQAVLQEISDISGCGFSTTAAAISSSSSMVNFVKKVFFTSITPITPIDSSYSIVQESDSDGDGILDNRDRCPNTPRGAVVDKDGCWSFRGVLFDVNKASIKAGFENTFDNATKVLRLNPSLTVEIQGHTDSQGSAQYNQNLSERRANSVKYLLIKNGIDASRLVTIGFGEAEPVSDNHTRAGRANNRRVVFKRTDK